MFVSGISFLFSNSGMTNHKVSTFSRTLLFVCGLALTVVLFTPIWRIDLQAPQYPEGLKMFIYANRLSGDVTIINGLNHYIGMKTLQADDFREFSVLPGIIIFFSALFLVSAYTGKRIWLNILCLLFVAFGILAMADFWRWEYEYGHNLNPNAAIIVPGMAYQPPLIGFKQLLNFGAYSMPATGGWIFVAVGFMLLTGAVAEWRLARKKTRLASATRLLLIGMICSLTLNGCNSGPQRILIGHDNCDFCKMKISDNRFGAEIVTARGKLYKFDDAHCMLSFVKSDKIPKKEIASVYFTDYKEPHQLVAVGQVYLLQSPALRSPMNGNIAAVRSEGSLVDMLSKFSGQKVTWEEVQR
jgi:copper chaperone NosL